MIKYIVMARFDDESKLGKSELHLNEELVSACLELLNLSSSLIDVLSRIAEGMIEKDQKVLEGLRNASKIARLFLSVSPYELIIKPGRQYETQVPSDTEQDSSGVMITYNSKTKRRRAIINLVKQYPTVSAWEDLKVKDYWFFDLHIQKPNQQYPVKSDTDLNLILSYKPGNSFSIFKLLVYHRPIDARLSLNSRHAEFMKFSDNFTQTSSTIRSLAPQFFPH